MTRPHPLIVLQSVCTTWTKASRGGASARARNRTPDAVELPSSVLRCSDGLFFLHEVVYTENNHFQQPLERQVQQKQTNPCWYNCLQFSPDENALGVTLAWERSEGMPRRSPFPRTAWSFQRDQWGRLIYNLRNPGEDHWIYKKYVISIGFFHSFSLRIFLEAEPAHTYRDLAQLW